MPFPQAWISCSSFLFWSALHLCLSFLSRAGKVWPEKQSWICSAKNQTLGLGHVLYLLHRFLVTDVSFSNLCSGHAGLLEGFLVKHSLKPSPGTQELVELEVACVHLPPRWRHWDSLVIEPLAVSPLTTAFFFPTKIGIKGWFLKNCQYLNSLYLSIYLGFLFFWHYT